MTLEDDIKNIKADNTTSASLKSRPNPKPFENPTYLRDARLNSLELNNRHISSNLVIVEIGSIPIGLLSDVIISEKIEQIPINVWGNAVIPDFTIGNFNIQMVGKLILTQKMSIIEEDYLPRNPLRLISQSLSKTTFDVAIYSRNVLTTMDEKHQENAVIGTSRKAEPIIKLTDCRYTGSDIEIKSGAPIISKFTLVAQMDERNFSGDENDYKNALAFYNLENKDGKIQNK